MPAATGPVSVDTLLWLLSAALFVAVVVRYLNLPYTVALVIAGLGLGLTGLLPNVTLTSESISHIFLPALLFQAAISLRLDLLRQMAIPILVLAIVGVAISVFFIGGIFSAALGFALPVAIVFAAMVSATDPVAVLATFKKLGVPAQLEMIVEGESLFNDGTALVVFQISLLVAQDRTVTVQTVAGSLLLTLVGGAVLGGLAGLIFSHLLRLSNDHLVETGLSTILAYSVYLGGEAAHVSPVIAIVVAGIVLANHGRDIGMSPRAQVVLGDIWEYVAFLMNSLLFLLVGMQMHLGFFATYWRAILLSISLVLLSRAAVIYGLSPLMSLVGPKLPASWQHLTFWGGLRGAMTVAMVLSLPAGLPQREMLVACTFSVVLFTILAQGLTIDWIVERLGVRVADGKHSSVTGELAPE